MNLKLHPRQIRSAFAALLLMSLTEMSFASQRFDAKLSGVMNKADAEKVKDSAYKPMRMPARVEIVKLLVRFSDNNALDAIRNAGGTVNSVLGNIASVAIPAHLLGNLVSINEIQYMEAEKSIPKRLSSSVPATRANLIRSGVSPDLTGATGAGVIVGVVDDGLDFRHLTFRNTDGSTRLLGLWDQRESGAAGSPPAGFSYGGECTVQMLNDAINNAGGCTQPSTGNHGTHVGGIAAGNGQQTGNGQLPYRFVGMAPKADMLVANSIGGGTGGNAVVDAIAWMKTKAAALGKPLVVNLSLGSYFGARDGTSNFEQALSNAGAAGVVVTAAAGNEGSDKLVATGQISLGQTKSVTFNWANTVNKDQKIEMWYPGVNQYAIKLTGPNGCAIPEFVMADAAKTYTLACGTIEVTSTEPQANNDDRQILVSFTISPANPAGFHGDWIYELRGDVVASPETDFSLICGEDGNGLLFTSNTPTGSTLGILTDTASATRTISVASYNTNSSWLTTGGVPNTPSNYSFGPIADVSSFSSRGPRRNCSNLNKCPVVMKPEITAPGAMIMSALGIDANVPTDDSIDADGKHVALNGTSMATPHVTGAVALLLQKNPTLTPEQVKQILFQNVQTNAFTTGLPSFDPASPLMPATTNNNWGYGILDIQAAYDAISVATNPYMGLWWNPNESGWGMSITQHGSMNFVAAYTYDNTGQPTWYVMSSCPVSGNSCTGDLYAVTGGRSPTQPWVALDFSKALNKVGTGALTFSNADNGTFAFVIDGASGSKTITRQVFATGGIQPAVDYTDLWWNPSEPGWGVTLTHQFGTIFATWYAYDDSGKAIWYVASSCAVVSSGCSGDLYQVSGGSMPIVTWNGANLAVTKVGAVSFAFSNSSTGTMTYTINGVDGSKAISRQLF